jgi:hypothetical protein
MRHERMVYSVGADGYRVREKRNAKLLLNSVYGRGRNSQPPIPKWMG